jgi:hypothetical protein
MSDYRVADGFNVALVSLTVLSPQPASAGIQYARQSFAIDGTPINEGPFVELVWSVLGTKAQYQSIINSFGLFNADSNDVTVYIRDTRFDYVRMNGKAIKPVPGNGVNWLRPFPRNITILVRDLAASS